MSRSELQAVLDCVKELQPCGIRAVADMLAMDRSIAKDYLEQLQADGFVKQKSNSHWVALKTSKPKPTHAWRQYPEGDDDHLGRAVKESVKKSRDDLISQAQSECPEFAILLNTATTDDLIEQVKQGEKAREELRRRVEGLL